uniref:FAD dependent oxidoreductase n=1 Tax=Pristionchus pacificus TaxID=54126 RepID=A0A8R1YT60_PRIPA
MIMIRFSFSIPKRGFSSRLSASTDVVVCGGGIAGSSIAYHLARRGKRVCLIEKHSIGGAGATSKCGGLVSSPLIWDDPACEYMARKSINLYESLADIKGFEYIKSGRLWVTTTERGQSSIERLISKGKVIGGIEKVDHTTDLTSLMPVLNTKDIKATVFSTEDVCLDAVALCQELAAEASLSGARISEGISVTEVLLGHDRQVYAVDTTEGLIETSVFVDVSGIWSGHISVKNLPHGRVQLASFPSIYQNLLCPRLPSASILCNDQPIVYDMDRNVVIHAGSNRTLIAGFNEESMRAASKKDDKWMETRHDWDLFHGSLGDAIARIPMIGSMKVGELSISLEAYTPDGACTIGESSQAKGYFVAGGFCGQGLSLAGGVGEVLSDWIIDGRPSIDVSRIDVARFLELHANQQYLSERIPEVASLTYRNTKSGHQFHSARNLRMSPIYHQLKAAGAIFGETMGYERPLWFESKGPEKSVYSASERGHIGKAPWFNHVEKEYAACRERVGLIDMSSFTKFEISGPDAVSLLQYLCSADIDRPIGTTVFTGMQNESGGYVSDCTLSRLGDESFFMVAPTIQQDRVFNWMNKWAHRRNSKVHIQDVTAAYTALDVVGPLSRHLLSDLTDESVSPTCFPSFRCKEINIGMATGIRAISVSHCGELGWVLYIPNEQAQNVYERIVEAGREYSLQHAGYYTLRHLRIEKFYVYWGQDIDATVTPVECGRSFRVHLQKDFIGKEAIERQMESGIYKRFVHVMMDDFDPNRDPSPIGGEFIYKDGVMVGHVTSSAYGFTLGAQVCIAVIHKADGISMPFLSQGKWHIEIAGRKYGVRISPHSPSLPMESSEQPNHYRPTQ